MELLPGSGGEDILVKGIKQIFRQLTGRNAYHLGKFLPLAGAHLAVEANHPVGKGSQGVLVPSAQGYRHHQLFQRDRGLALQGTGLGLLGLGNAHRIHNDKVVLVLGGRGGHLLQVVLAEGTGTPALHLLKIVLAAYIPHENQALDGFDIGAGGNHVHCDRNTGIVAIAELTEHTLRILGGVGNLFTELVSLAEFLPDNLDDVVGVAVCFGKNQSLRDFLTPWEQRGKQVVPECADHHTDLAGIDNVPVQLSGLVIHILI